jgi:hypothetical protein
MCCLLQTKCSISQQMLLLACHYTYNPIWGVGIQSIIIGCHNSQTDFELAVAF